MTSWAIVVDVWYLPPETARPGEDGISFSSRVKRKIAERGGLVDMDWLVSIFFLADQWYYACWGRI